MELTAQPLDLTLATPFRISRGEQRLAHNVAVQLSAEDATGIGEAAPSHFYGEQQETVFAALSAFADALGTHPEHIEDIDAELNRLLQGNPSAKAAINMALWDLAGQRHGLPVYALLGLNPQRAPQTSFTIGLGEPSEMAQKAQAAKQYPILKIKVGKPGDLEAVRAIRDVTDATLRVDANAAWTAKEALRMIEALVPYNVEFVEQPVAQRDLEGLRLVREHSPLPIFADESCVTLEDIPRVVGCVDGINIKLMKCGGITQALKMIATARAHHLKVMLGCMIESSLAITAAAQLSPLVDYADLDGALLIRDDPYEGVTVKRGQLVLPERPGLGVRRRVAHAGAEGAHADEMASAPPRGGGA